MSANRSSTHLRVAEVLIDIEAELRGLQLWQAEPPSAEALASSEPFCIDTLSFPQWLQFVFLPRMQMLVDQVQPLPSACGIAPMAEEYFRGLPHKAASLIEQIARIDTVLSTTLVSSRVTA